MLTDYQKICKIIKETKVDGLTKRLKSKHDLWEIIEHWCKDYPYIRGSEKIYLYYHQITKKPSCMCGSENLLIFKSFNTGYTKFCSSNCPEACKHRFTITKEQGKKFGLANEQAKQKQQQTLKNKYGVINPAQIEENIKRLKKYNPMFSPEIKEKIKLTLQRKYKVDNPARINWPENLQEKLNDTEWFEEQFNEKGPYILSEEYKVHYSVFLNKAVKLGLRNKYESSSEKSIDQFLIKLGIDFKKRIKSIIPPFELDFYIPSKNLAIEYCGLYWHGEGAGKTKTYHLEKMEKCKEKGIRLITIFEDEWLEKNTICKNRIKSILKISNKKAGARKLDIKEINPTIAANFLSQHHIQGKAQSNWRFGAYLNNNLVAVMTFSKNRVSLGSKGNNIELIRFATDGNSYPGVASKLFKTFIKKYNPNTIISYCDNRWGIGKVYEILDFKYIGETKPNYWYFRNQKRYHRFNFRKSNLQKFSNFSKYKTEFQIMAEQKYDRIWDCGHSKWVWKNNDITE